MKLTRFGQILEKGLKDVEDNNPKLVINALKRDEFIKIAFKEGGKGFVERIRKYARTEKGEKVQLSPWYEQAALLLGDLRISKTLTTGSAQIGKTLINTFLLVDLLTTGKLNCAWFYDQATNLENNVPLQFKPIIREWIRAMEEDGFKFNRREDKQINTRYQVEGVNAIFSYVRTKTVASKAQSGQAIAGSQTVSFQADIAFEEERSQYPPGADDPIERRLDASPVLTHPIRELGTPGGGQGIELEIKKADRHFYPHYKCPLCKEIKPLDPKGCLLKKGTKKNASGQIVSSYLSEIGRPIEKTIVFTDESGKNTEQLIRYWWHTDKNNPVESAVICCSECGCILDTDTRWNSELRCLNTGQTVDEFIKEVEESNYLTKRWKVGIHFSPLCRRDDSVASRIIKDGQDAEDTTDWQQQGLGHPSETDSTSVTLDMIKACIGIQSSKANPDLIVCGLDFGRSDDWLTIMACYLPSNWEKMRTNEVYEKTVREVLFAGGIMRDDIESVLAKYKVEYGLVDNEPDRESAIKLCDKIYNSKLNLPVFYAYNPNTSNLNSINTNPSLNPNSIGINPNVFKPTKLEMVDQQPNYSEIAKKDSVEDGGNVYPCWKIRRERFLNDVLQGFIALADDGYPLYRLPESWESWISINKKNDLSPVQHLMGINKSFDGKTWEKKGKCDLYVALSLAEAAFYINLLTYSTDVLRMLQVYRDEDG